MLNLILNLVVLFIALLIQVCKCLFSAGKCVVIHIFRFFDIGLYESLHLWFFSNWTFI